MTVLVLLLIITAFFAQQGLDFQDQIEDDVEIFLPEGAPSTKLLLEVEKEWSTDIAIIYVQTPNAFSTKSTENITSESYLREISWVEGDDNNFDQGRIIDKGIDYDKIDHGENDGVMWIISPAQVIKEINSADGRFNNSMCEHGINTRIPIQIDCNLPGGGEYVIPDQARIDQIIEESNGGFDALFKDTNDMDPTVDSDKDGNYTNDQDGDGIWDTAAIIIGMHSNPKVTDEYANFDELHAHFQDVIDARPNDMANTEMTVTGLTKVLEDISEEIYKDLLMILPWSVFFTILFISAIHRSLKVVVITGTPIMMALAVTFGISVIMDVHLTPMIVATFPILIGLGVDYALHMVNRIEEVRRKKIDSLTDENERRRRQGKPPEEVPDIWDANFYKECILEMASSTGVAVFLSAMTTIIGFSVLILPSIVPITPIRSVGLTLVIGIISTLIFSIILVPTLAWLTKFNKRTNPQVWGGISKIPIKGFLVIILLTGAVTTLGLLSLDEMNEPITGSSEAPDGIESLDALAEYSRQFGSGQTSLFIYHAEDRIHDNKTDQIRDLPVLDSIDFLENRIDAIDSTNTTSIITFLRTIPATITLADGVTLYEGSLWDLLHDPCWESTDPISDPECAVWLTLEFTGADGREGLRKDMVNVVFDTLTDEVKSMLLNEDGTKAIVYVTQPYMNLNVAGKLRDEIDGMLSEEQELEGTRTSLLTGGLPVSLDINKGIHDTQNQTTIITLIILTIVLCFVFKSIRLGLYSMIPVAVVILWQPLLMQNPDVSINIFTVMIGTIVFGIGVDDSIHVMHRIQEEGETPNGIATSIEETGQTIFETTFTTVAGISAGFLAAFPGLENFFMIMCMLIFFAFLTSAFLLPAIFTLEHSIRAKIRGEGSWVDFGDGISLASELSMTPLDALLED
jgi:hypothetical protein